MKCFFYCLLIASLFSSCGSSRIKADKIFHNAVIYTVDSSFSVVEAMAIQNGKILATGSSNEILEKYSSDSIIDLQHKTVFPGFIDAHCHFYGYGLGLDELNLVGTKSFDEVIQRLTEYAKTHPSTTGRAKWIIGRGWDQNDWANKEYPDRRKIDSLFPDRPVFLKRIDGHAALANKTALHMAKVTGETAISGGKIEKRLLFHGEEWVTAELQKEIKHLNYPYHVPTGILIDNAVDLVERTIPQPSEEQIRKAFLSAQRNCFEVGLTTVDDAGLMKSVIDVINKLQKNGELKMRVYAMLSDSAPNYDFYLKNGPYKTDRLNVCSFKFYGDGALGSRGACMREDYSDKPGWRGFLLSSNEYYQKRFLQLQNEGSGKWQFNAHAIGDSAVKNMCMLAGCGKIISGLPDSSRTYGCVAEGSGGMNKLAKQRNRIEHFQILDPDFFVPGVIPSVQPTHATSDMYWVEERIGRERVKIAYAYKTLLKQYGIIALGTDFPVEDISPFKTFYAAVFRKDANGFPEGGWQAEEALTREETIRGMTIWAAYANFEEQEKGSIEEGKFADFVILDTDLMKAPEKEILKTKVISAYINGEKVFGR